jgi:hypothetical protein
MDRRPLATRTEVAAHLRVPIATLEQWAHHGRGPRYVRIGRHARYRWVDVETWVNEQERCQSSPDDLA